MHGHDDNSAPNSPTPSTASTSRSDDIEESLSIIAYEIYPQVDMPVAPAPINRTWMDNTASRFAYRCLPLTLANQAGWIIRNPSSFTVRWNGASGSDSTAIVFDDDRPDERISSLFGHGTITFHLPFLFRTPSQINLWVKGPSNWPKHGVQALEGIVETDWTSASFTMNWKLTSPGNLVRFERGEPICMIVPYPRQFIDRFEPVVCPLSSDAELEASYQKWRDGRNELHRLVQEGDAESLHQGWQKDYFQGRDPGQDRFGSHQTRLAVRPFKREA